MRSSRFDLGVGRPALGVDFGGSVVQLTDKYRLLHEEEYVMVSGIVTPLLSKALRESPKKQLWLQARAKVRESSGPCRNSLALTCAGAPGRMHAGRHMWDGMHDDTGEHSSEYGTGKQDLARPVHELYFTRQHE